MLMRSRIFRFTTLATIPEVKPHFPSEHCSLLATHSGGGRNLSAMLMTIATHSSLILMSDLKPGESGFGMGKNKLSIFATSAAFSKKYYPNLTIIVPTIKSIARSSKGKLLQQYIWTVK